MSGYETITVSEDQGVVTITLDRPEVMNALDARMRREIRAAVQAAEMQGRVIVLTGAGRAFCSGQELYDPAEMEDLDIGQILREEYVPMIEAITHCKLPVIAAVNGAAAGAGANLALACDVVIASESASFTQAFTKIGLIPDAGGTYFLPRQIGTARAMGAMLFADKISARQAEDWGMIYEAVADESFSSRVNERAKMLAKGPSVAFSSLKTALRQSGSNNLGEQLLVESDLQVICGKTADFCEGVSAFREKRSPTFTGN